MSEALEAERTGRRNRLGERHLTSEEAITSVGFMVRNQVNGCGRVLFLQLEPYGSVVKWEGNHHDSTTPITILTAYFPELFRKHTSLVVTFRLFLSLRVLRLSSRGNRAPVRRLFSRLVPHLLHVLRTERREGRMVSEGSGKGTSGSVDNVSHEKRQDRDYFCKILHYQPLLLATPVRSFACLTPSLHSSLRLSVGSGVTSPTPTARVRRVERGVWWEDGDTGPFTVTPGLFLSSSQLCSRQDSIYLRTFTVIISVSLPEDHETGFQLPGWPLDRKDYNYIYFFTLGRLNSY